MTLLVLYVALLNLFPAEILPAMAQYRVAYWTGMIGLAVAATSSIYRGTHRLRSPVLWLMCGLTGAMMLSLLMADRWLGGILMVFNKFGVSLTMFFLICWNVSTLRRLRIVIATTVLCSLALMVMGALSYHYGFRQDIFLFSYGGGGDEGDGSDAEDVIEEPRIRGVGTMADPNDLALAFVVCLPLVALAWRPRRAIRNLVLVVIPLLAIGYGIYLTRSRGGAIAALLVFVLLGVKGLSRGTGVWVLAAAGCVFLIMGAASKRAISLNEESAAGRIEAWSEGLALLKSNPITGIGFKNFADHHDLTAHNSLILCAAELGMVGYGFWLGIIILTLRNLKQLRIGASETDEEGEAPPAEYAEIARWAGAVEIALYGFLFAGFFLSRAYTPTLFLLIALGVALTEIGREAGVRVATPVGKTLFATTPATAMASIVFFYVFTRAHQMFLR